MKINFKNCLVLAAALLMRVELSAAGFDIIMTPTELMLFPEEQVVVTATKMEQKLSDAPGSVTIISEEQIKITGARTLADILKTVPGVYVIPSERHLQKMYVRGVGSSSSYNDKILLMLDGVPQREPLYGHAFIDEYLPVENIKRVEVVRGPGSALYGTNAFAGVVNVITKDASDVKETEITGGIGSRSSSVLSALTGYRSKPADVLVFARRYKTDGDGPSFSRKYEKNRFDEDPAESSAVLVKTAFGDFDFSAFLVDFKHKFPTNRDIPETVWDSNWFFYKNYFLQLGWEKDIAESTVLMFKTWWQYYDNDSFYQLNDESSPRATVISSDVWTYKWTEVASVQTQVTHRMPSILQDFILGGQYDYEHIDYVEDVDVNRGTGKKLTPSPFWMPEKKGNNLAVYFQDVFAPAEFVDITAGVRTDIHQVYGESTNPRGGIVLKPSNNSRVKLLYGQAFRAPDYRQLYVKTGSWTGGNEDLKPEKIKTPEVELDYDISKNIRTRLNLYKSSVSDMIITRTTALGEQYINSASRIEIKGLEYVLKFDFLETSAYLNYSYSEARDIDTNSLISGIPLNTGSAGATISVLKNAKINTTILYTGKATRWSGDTNKYDKRFILGSKRPATGDFFNLNISGKLEVNDFDITATVYNLIDERQYAPDEDPKRADIELPGRNYMIKASYKL